MVTATTDAFKSYLCDKGHQSPIVAKTYGLMLEKMLVSGVTDDELLNDDIDKFVDDYIIYNSISITNRAKAKYRSMVRRYREFRGVE